MDTLETKQMEMFIRVVENRAEFALAALEGSYGAGRLEKLVQVNEDLATHAYEQSRGESFGRGSSGSVEATREELERQLDAIYQTVRILVPGRPELKGKFLPPRDIGNRALVTLARTYGNDAFPLKADLIERGLRADFIADLDAAAIALDTALNEREKGLGRQHGATAGIDELTARGLSLVRELRVLVRNAYAKDPVKLALWKSVSHVEKPPRRSRKKKGNGGDPPPPPAQP